VQYAGRRFVVAEMAGRRIARVRVETIFASPVISTDATENEQRRTDN
jgi:hypothetical protein